MGARTLWFLTALLLLSPALRAEEITELTSVEPVTQLPVQPRLQLPSPPRPEEVQAILVDVRTAGAPEALRVARALGAAGGQAVLDALRDLLGHSDIEVRLAALEAVTDVALRSDRLAEAVHTIAKHEKTELAERIAALRALGSIGDGSDFPLLLRFSDDSIKSVALRTEAFRAMAALSGARLPYVHARWAYWWRKQAGRKHTLLEKAIVGFDEARDEDEQELYAAVIESLSWLDLPYAAAALERWLRGAKPRLRPLAARLTGALRLADLSGRLALLARRHHGEDTGEAARSALDALGYAWPETDEPAPEAPAPAEATRGD